MAYSASLLRCITQDASIAKIRVRAPLRLVPVDNMAAQAAFLQKVLRMDGIKADTIWAKKSFPDGVDPPAAVANDAAVVAFIQRTPGGCGHLTIGPPVGVTVIGKY
ncbi:MAG: hypothetical protein WA446_10510 [Steroidobacteraceae bacterium]